MYVSSQWTAKKHTEFFNYFLNKDKKYHERIYNLSPKKRDSQKANFRRLVKPFNVKNGTLYHGDVEAVTRDRVSRILQACQNPATGGYFGRDKTYKKIQARYWWKRMKTEIEIFIQNCDECFEHKPKLLTGRPELHPIQVPLIVFTARCYASAVLAMALCVSLCPSVTSRSSTKMAKRRITHITPHDSPGTLVS